MYVYFNMAHLVFYQTELDTLMVSSVSTSTLASAVVPAISPPPYSNNTASTLTSFKAQLATLLNIPVHLAGSGDVSLHVAYQKYCAYLTATKMYEKMLEEKSWTG